ncbi:hypothetical protein AX774_g1956 [Zancudomyces culisetae]|uniref:Uncharacterized protein n=1 Tax=Zancudomyces culisetae TaxID=1213189 RepID=A0A1R1PUE3_ZANCU|nr:hypothetical protein AX774_g3433 [Zancudomyces culisetae]OMH84512.1 hypothetical protein AX774_g1956 [Zancudomyces culisetae]|eukprot:OMH83063.1 hypothetical protein AX774_g3433 [Zancudomyces culisetae]
MPENTIKLMIPTGLLGEYVSSIKFIKCLRFVDKYRLRTTFLKYSDNSTFANNEINPLKLKSYIENHDIFVPRIKRKKVRKPIVQNYMCLAPEIYQQLQEQYDREIEEKKASSENDISSSTPSSSSTPPPSPSSSPSDHKSTT